ncbi:putative DNA double-strand break repair Rad50 ATPase [Operophtera brumata]|uniref:Putative DNA double-strand break repair Rad50 ATPase n=1 Tax=Operophtera brumata TaxID=104452 RepID=A0A0L7LVB6_OPEBR|nr:putative DNA double-strand break repair Rad50 ATPase [Operophtera brumata]
MFSTPPPRSRRHYETTVQARSAWKKAELMKKMMKEDPTREVKSKILKKTEGDCLKRNAHSLMPNRKHWALNCGRFSKKHSSSEKSTEARKMRLEYEAAKQKADIERKAVEKDAQLEKTLVEQKFAADIAALESVASKSRRSSQYQPTEIDSIGKVQERLENSHIAENKNNSDMNAARDGERDAAAEGFGSTDMQNLVSAIYQSNLQNKQLLSRFASSKDLPQFNGDPLEWLAYKLAYDESTKICNYSDAENMWRLRKSLKGEAKETGSATEEKEPTATFTDTMFASLKSKIKEETGSDISKITSSWRSGAFLGRISLRDDSSISPQLEAYLTDRTGGQIDQPALQQQYSTQLEAKLRERDAYWEQKIEEEELEQSSREWARSRAELTSALAEADARARDLTDQLALVKAALSPESEHHHMQDDEYDRVCRERVVLTRQLQEAKMALADVKTSWSGQIASLETQVARLSRQAGEEGSERRRVEEEKRETEDKLVNMAAELDKTKQNLINSEAKVVRLNCEVHSLAMEVKALRKELTEENRRLIETLDNERTLVKILREKVDKSNRLYDEQKAEVNHLNSVVNEMQHDYVDMERKIEKEKREKDEALLRNAHMSQTIEMSQCDNQAACMLIKETEETRKSEIAELRGKIEQLTESENNLKKSIKDLETDICDKNKKVKSLENRISDMKKTLQRELQSSKSDLSTAEEQDIKLEARQLTRALAVLLRLSPREEALLRAALPPRTGIAAWFPSLTNT